MNLFFALCAKQTNIELVFCSVSSKVVQWERREWMGEMGEKGVSWLVTWSSQISAIAFGNKFLLCAAALAINMQCHINKT